MADVIVTFGRALGNPPVMQGNPRRTVTLTISGTAATTSIAAGDVAGNRGENIVDLLAGADCWVEIGPDPTAAAPSSAPENRSWPMKSGERMQMNVDEGDKVSIIQRS